MPKFQLNIQGSDYEVEAPDESALPEIAETIIGRERSQPSVNTFLPNQPQVEQNIAQRTDSVQRFKEEMQYKPKNLLEASLQPTMLGLKAVAIPFQRTEAGLANVGLEAQKGNFNPIKLGGEFAKGISGKKQGEFGDIVRTTGFGGEFNELLAVPTGFMASLGMANAMTRGLVVGMLKSMKTILPKLQNQKWLVENSKLTNSIADDAVKAIQSEQADMYSIIGKNPLKNSDKLQNVIDDFAKYTEKGTVKGGVLAENLDDVMQKIKVDLGDDLSYSIENAKKIKDIISKEIPEGVWMKGKKMISLSSRQRKLTDAYWKLDEAIRESLMGEEVGLYNYIQEKSTDVYRISKVIKRMVIDETGQPIKTGQLIRATSGKPETAGRMTLLKQFRELNEDMGQVIKNMNKFRQRQQYKRVLPWALGAASTLGGIAYGAKKLNQTISGE